MSSANSQQLDSPSRGRSQLRAVGGTRPWTNTEPQPDSQTNKPIGRPNLKLCYQSCQTGQPARTANLLEVDTSRESSSQSHEAIKTFNDPSAGSPTETLLRLLLPLNASVWSSSRSPVSVSQEGHNPRTSLKRSIGSSDGRCVQRAGT